MENLTVHSMDSLEDGAAPGNIDGLFYGMSLRREDRTGLQSSIGGSVGFYKVYKDGNFMALLM